MPRGDLRDRLDGNELDLSMDSLTVVPIKELAALPRATHVDLSCNLLQTLTDQFCILEHLVKLDLSKNQLTSLPEQFGSLQRLQYLDLFENKLTTLPVSMYKMKSLRYLDVKTNPLNETLLKVAGDCMDDTQCKNCAKRVLAFMKDVNSEQERRRQKELQTKREMEAEKRAEEERERLRERERIKAAKQAMKEKRRLEYEAKQAEQRKEPIKKEENVEKVRTNGLEVKPAAKPRTKGLPCLSLLISVLVLLLAVLVGLVYYCHQTRTHALQCRPVLAHYRTARAQTTHLYTTTVAALHTFVKHARAEGQVAFDAIKQKLS